MPFDSLPENNPAIPQVVLDLIAARNYLDTYGWCKGSIVNGAGKRCMMGATGWATHDQERENNYLSNMSNKEKLKEYRVYQVQAVAREKATNTALLEQINKGRTRQIHSIPGWNDMTSRRYPQVRAIFDKAIEAETEKHNAKEKFYAV